MFEKQLAVVVGGAMGEGGDWEGEHKRKTEREREHKEEIESERW